MIVAQSTWRDCLSSSAVVRLAMLVRLLSGREISLDISGLRSAVFSRAGGISIILSSGFFFILNPWRLYVDLHDVELIAFWVLYCITYFYIYYSFLLSTFFLTAALGIKRVYEPVLLFVVVFFHFVFVDFILCLDGICRDLAFRDGLAISAMSFVGFEIFSVLFFQILLGRCAVREPENQPVLVRDPDLVEENVTNLAVDDARIGAVEMAIARDHYVEIYVGSRVNLIRGRFANFVSRMPDESGIQVNRSVWIGADMIAKVIERSPGKLILELKTGENFSVARPRVNETKRWLHRNHKLG